MSKTHAKHDAPKPKKFIEDDAPKKVDPKDDEDETAPKKADEPDGALKGDLRKEHQRIESEAGPTTS